jgi:hypothetical protein
MCVSRYPYREGWDICEGHTARSHQIILKADIKRRVRQTRKSHPCLARDILRSSVIVPYRILDLRRATNISPLPRPLARTENLCPRKIGQNHTHAY